MEIYSPFMMTCYLCLVQLSRKPGDVAVKNPSESGELSTPQDGTEETQSNNDHSHKMIWTDIRNMTERELGLTEVVLWSVKECGMTLIFSDQSSQLRERKVGVYDIVRWKNSKNQFMGMP